MASPTRFLAVLAAACFGMALAAPARVQGQESVEAERLWNSYMRICPQMLTDPQAYANNLQIPGPNGEKVVSQAGGGNIVEFDTTIDGFAHTGLILVIGKHQEIGCSMSTYSVGQPASDLMSDRINATFSRRIADYDGVEVLGGRVDKEVPSPVAGMPVAKVQDYYQYWIVGLVQNADVVAQVILGDGYVSYHMHRYIVLEDSE